ncbi:MAG: YlxR family protein [Ruminococcus bromii]|mgnify:FL=1|nr:YlxR family protein [Ruminococcus bromii]MDD6433665.1 YlxR family protein [Ruminococcus bromii]MDY4712014.1 YlxR family protein [Ruminococcus bromii]
MKKVPMRKCTGCMEMKPKTELIRVVKSPDIKDENGEITASGEISLDLTGKKSGRGAYVCKSAECLEKAHKAHRIERSLSCKIPEEIYEQLRTELENIT